MKKKFVGLPGASKSSPLAKTAVAKKMIADSERVFKLINAAIDTLGAEHVAKVRDHAQSRLDTIRKALAKTVVIHYKVREDGTIEHAKIIYESLNSLKLRYPLPHYQFTCIERKEFRPELLEPRPDLMGKLAESLKKTKGEK